MLGGGEEGQKIDEGFGGDKETEMNKKRKRSG